MPTLRRSRCRVAAGISDDELLRDRLSGGLQIVMAPDAV